MSELDGLILEGLAAHLPSRGLESSFGPNGLRIPSLSLVVRVRDAEEREPDISRWWGLSAIFQTSSIDSIGGGMEVLHTGMGATRVEAAANAAHQWIEGVLPVIISAVTHRDQPQVHHSKMVVAIEQSGEQFGWRVHLGPIITRMYSDDEPPDDLPHDEIYRALFNVVHPFAAHSELFWLECFAAHYPDGRVNATCRKLNDDWPEGRLALLEWAETWPDTEGIVTQRQFIIFEPAAVDQRLAEKLPLRRKKQPWWRLLWK